MTDRNQYAPIISELNKHYISFSQAIGEYLKSFTEDILLSFSFSKEEIKEILKLHYIFAASAVNFLEKTDSFVASLTKFLYDAYDKNDQDTVIKLGKIISRQFDCKDHISSFIRVCEEAIKADGQNVSPRALYKEATIFKKNFDALLN